LGIASAIAFALMSVLGCHSGDSEVYPTWATEPRAYVPNSNSLNAFDTYAMAAEEVEVKAAASLGRVSFFPGQKHEVEAEIKDYVRMVVTATRRTCEFKFVPHKPFQPVKYQSGWRLIGRVILWNVEDACQAADYDTAISSAIAGTRFGFDLTGGGATDASLGMAIADDVRKAIAPSLIKMSPTQLDRLAKGMKAALDAKPAITVAIGHEQENMLQAIQNLQDCMKSGHLKQIQDGLGADSNEAIRYLEGIAGNTHKRTSYFDTLSKAAENEFALVEQDSELPVTSRQKPNGKIDAPWKKLAKHIYGAARPLLDINDATVARTRLLILYAEIDRLGIRNKAYPANLEGFTPALTIDPYSGSPFLYHADQAEFSLYSVGKNGRDDGGDTDSSFTMPDLRLECTQ